MQRLGWILLFGFCVFSFVFPAAALGQMPEVQYPFAASVPIHAMPGETIELDSWSFGASNPTDTGGKGHSAGKISLSDITTGTILAETKITLGANVVQYTVPADATTPFGPGQLLVAVVITNPPPNCPICAPMPPPFAIFTASLTVFTPAPINGVGGLPTNIRTIPLNSSTARTLPLPCQQ